MLPVLQESQVTDDINRPPHYTEHPSGVECIEVTEWLGFNLGNAFKYLFRRNTKDDLRGNLEKALWYLEREKARTGVWIEEVPEGTFDTLADKVNRIVGYEPSYVGSAMSIIVGHACGHDVLLIDAIAMVKAEIRRVCK